MNSEIAKMMCMSMINNNPSLKSNPMVQNLVNMANSGNMTGVEQMVKNIASAKGINYDKALGDLINKYTNT